AHGPHGYLKHAGSPSRPSHVTYRAHSRARAPLRHELAAGPARGSHPRDRGLASVGRRERATDLLRDLSPTLPSSAVPLPQQHQHRPAPARSREPRAQRARPARRGDHEVELRRATLVQAPARLVRLVQELPEPPHVSPGQQLGPEPGAGGLPHDVQRARAQRLCEGALEARQPASWRGVSRTRASRLSACAAATVNAAEEASPAPTGTSLATATRAPAPRGAAPAVSSSRITPATYAVHPAGRPSRQSMRAGSPSIVEVCSISPSCAGPTATLVRA